MNFHKLGKVTATLAVVLSLVSVPELAHAGKKERNIALGIGLGLLGGAIVSQGDPRAVIGGAVAGGLIGGAVAKDNRRSWRDDRRDWRRGQPPRHHDHYRPVRRN
ncbi:hypothetical protein [Agrobacterium tumefaciens]|jgi:hypothetical protein|uniref:Glycine zipper 2TM domain-containing protein n=1 Tax=Agrobacterium tumefaciens TaxID=358 RepID=A0A4D7Z5T5_AGRTU|nr:hypothetical protein [Agrobacterium tumefaciens]MCP2138317.1 hypothetical protein [Rhizobium sp. SLBN-94]QCL98184.1 hypothetical protein CFBP7129_28830 [Agrobacterium tumefaciens]